MANWNSHISDIITSVRAVSKDTRVSKRYAYNLIIDGFNEVMKSKAEYRNILSNTNLIKKKCMDVSKDISNCDNCADYGLLVTTEKITPYVTSKGDGVIAVTSVSGKEYQRLTSILDVKNSVKRRFSTGNYYAYSEGSIYVGGKNDSIEQVVVWYLPTADEITKDGAGGAGACGFLQTECTIPSDILRAVKTNAINIVFNSLRVPIDEKPNLDSNDK